MIRAHVGPSRGFFPLSRGGAGAAALRRPQPPSLARRRRGRRRSKPGRWRPGCRTGSGSRILGPLWEEARRRVAAVLELPDPATLCFAPNTHEFALRILSALPERPRVLTTTGEFHSFSRQVARLEEDGLAAGDAGSGRARRRGSGAAGGGGAGGAVRPRLGVAGLLQLGLRARRGGARRGGGRRRGAGHRRLSRLHGGADEPRRRGGAASSTWRAATNTPWRARARASSTRRRAGCRARATPAGSRPSATCRGRNPARVPFPRDGMRFMGATFDPSGLFRLVAALRWLEARGRVGRGYPRACARLAGALRRGTGGHGA